MGGMDPNDYGLLATRNQAQGGNSPRQELADELGDLLNGSGLSEKGEYRRSGLVQPDELRVVTAGDDGWQTRFLRLHLLNQIQTAQVAGE